ncbi:putative serine protease XkdF [Tibeticola sediminis]|uniref:Putative serine protease XkdF n=1 Tax=Tibeticola sediminis TaxID=1917811 RepID=A0A3N4UR71_9BURK|nr:XkdF-like putative serine protease domain-containing protein [Tibeticola sediminis]RPE72528.1 putative serine protease XkdF [Tibeticola sediminis]
MDDHRGMPKLADLDVQFISLVKRPANGRRVILRGVSGAHEFAIRKADARLKRVYGIVYAPDSVDSQGDWTDAETIRKAADAWMLSGRASNVDREHDFSFLPAFVAESWLVRSGDPFFPDEKEGAWAVGIQVTDAALWDAIEAGEVEGLSLAGTARLEKGSDVAHEASLWRRIFTPKKEREMTPEDVRAIVREALDETVAKAEAEASREKLEKALADGQKEIEALKTALSKALDEAAALAKRIEALEAAPAKPAAPAEGGQAPETQSFV